MAGGDPTEAEDRTEAPTPRRLDRAREQGQVALSRDAVGFATLLGATLAAAVALPPLGLEMLRAMRGLLEVGPAGAEASAVLAEGLLRAAGLAVLPVFAATALAAVLATLAQTGWPRGARPLAPKPSKLSPIAGARRIFGPEALIELVRTLLKLGGVGAALWASFDLSAVVAALRQSPGKLLAVAGEAAVRLIVAALLAFAVLAALDLAWVRWRHLRQLRMSREEMREELKESEGDPLLKAKRRRIQESRARRRMLAAVPKAAVVITNPTHYAVALAYDQGQAAAPRLVAKGVDAMAARIRAAAEEHGVPIVGNPPLARALYRLEPDSEIPPEHWQAVAEILAYLWRLGADRTGAAGSRPGG